MTCAGSLLLAAARVAARVGASLRIASFAVWSRPAYTTRLGTDSEDLVLQEWITDLEKSANAAGSAPAPGGSSTGW